MNLESDYITQLTDNYFPTREFTGWGERTQNLTSITFLAEIFNQYIDAAQRSSNFKNSKAMEEDKELLLALSHNLLFLLNFMKNNNITYKDLFDNYIKHKKNTTHSHHEWPISAQNHSIN